MGTCCSDVQKKARSAKQWVQSGLNNTFSPELQKKKEIKGLRGKYKSILDSSDTFLSHHHDYQIQCSPFASLKKIRCRQVIEHYVFNDISHNQVGGKIQTSVLTQIAIKAWFQRTFLNCLQRAQRQFLEEGKDYDQVRRRLAEEYTFEIYQIGEFINAGFGKFSDGTRSIQVPLSTIMLSSDAALYPLLSTVQQKYPLVAQSEDITFPEVKPLKNTVDLLSLIPSKSYNDPQNLNIQTTLEDLRFLIDEANNEFSTFKSDMVAMLGEGTLTDTKVKRKEIDGKHSYNASAVRRVFIKWNEKMIELIPNLVILPEFVDFVTAKTKIADGFIFNSSVSPSTHEQIINVLSILLEAVKYKVGSTQHRKEFGLFLYDLLRCKTKRKTGEQVVELLQQLKKQSKTPSGKRFQVIRVKNRFELATRDLLINFRYGEHLIAEAQLCVDVPAKSELASKQSKFRHYLYELERGLFGPTLEILMQYEDFSRHSTSVDMEAEGVVKKRDLSKGTMNIKKANRICPQGHEMIAISDNIFGEYKLPTLKEDDSSKKQKIVSCNFCFQEMSLSKQYHYCYYCTVFYCLRCYDQYQKIDKKQILEICTRTELLKSVKNLDELKSTCSAQKGVLCLFYSLNSSISQMFVDQIILLLTTYSSQLKNIPALYSLDIEKQWVSALTKDLEITSVPTLVTFNQKVEPQTTLIGSTFHDIQALLQVAEKVAKKEPKGLPNKCLLCKQPMNNEKCSDKEADEKCQICMGANKIEKATDIFKVLKVSLTDFYCSNGHKRCGYCSYLSTDEPSVYKDHTGSSYLSQSIELGTTKCLKGHQTKITSQPQTYRCEKCEITLKGTQNGVVNYCTLCDIYRCSDCALEAKQGLLVSMVKDKSQYIQIVSHFLESKTEESYPCGCGKFFLKTYQSRKLDTGEPCFFKDTLIGFRNFGWECFVCKQMFSQSALHLACYHCDFATDINWQISHLQICIDCAVKSQMLGRIPEKKVIRDKTHLKYKNTHQIVITSVKRGESLTFRCEGCKELFYAFTERYASEDLNLDWCKACAYKCLTDSRPVASKAVSFMDQELAFVLEPPKLAYCSKCSLHLKEAYFASPDTKARIFLCIKCAEEHTK